MRIIPTGEILGATVEGLDLNCELDHATFAAVLKALGQYGVLRFPKQTLDADRQMAFSQRLGRWRSTSPARFRSRGIPR